MLKQKWLPVTPFLPFFRIEKKKLETFQYGASCHLELLIKAVTFEASHRILLSLKEASSVA
jgi:hypothetical protein